MLRVERRDQHSIPTGVAAINVQRRAWLRRTSFITRAVLCLVLGAMLGLALTGRAVRRGIDLTAIRVGAWSFDPDAGRPDINPYLRARYARTGQIPMPAADGAMLVAAEDDRGRKLDRRCSYELSGGVPQARLWTLEAADTDGFPIRNAAGRSSFTSADVLRQTDGRFMIAVSPSPRPGNWLPVNGTGRFVLVLRLYDSAVAALGRREIKQLPVPLIVAEPCP